MKKKQRIIAGIICAVLAAALLISLGTSILYAINLS